jgi:hypothetical protein
LTSVTAGSYLRSGGILTAPLWSTVKLPNTAAVGDIWHAATLNTLTGLAIGGVGTIIRSNGTIPAYTSFTIPNTFATGNVLYASATNVISGLAIGSTGQFMRWSGTVPTWSTLTMPNQGAVGGILVTTFTDTVGLLAFGGAGTIVRSTGATPAYTTFTIPNTFTAGDLPHASATNVVTGLAIGTAGKILRSTGTLPAWTTLTIPNTVVQGDILYASAANVLTALADVAVGSYLRSGGVSTAPLWSTLTLPNASAQGDIFYSTAANAMTVLVKNASATRYLSNTGTSNDPAWAQVALATGVSGTLPIANGGTNKTAWTDNLIVYATGTDVLGTNAGFSFDETTLTIPGQIAFPATQSASAGANTLDDYEEGDWTPVLTFGGGTTGITYTVQLGRNGFFSGAKIPYNAFTAGVVAVGIQTIVNTATLNCVKDVAGTNTVMTDADHTATSTYIMYTCFMVD